MKKSAILLVVGLSAGLLLTQTLPWRDTTPAFDYGVVTGLVDGHCPPAYKAKDPLKLAREFRGEVPPAQARHIREQFGDQICVSRKHPESAYELSLIDESRYQSAGFIPQGAFAKALADKSAQQALKTAIPGANGYWSPYGQGPLNASAADYPSVNTLGNVMVSGRIDHFDYDEVHDRLFASVGTGGVWMSEDLGDNWVSVGDNLPYQSVGAVAWSSAGGGTLVVVSGDPPGGGNSYTGLGAFWTNDLGLSWHKVEGVPDGALGYRVEVDKSRPEVIYIANSKGLFRSTDAGRSALNVVLPTSPECAGVHGPGPCQFANFVTDVIVKQPGGTTAESGGAVLAVVGYRGGSHARYPDGTVHAPGNGFYRSASGEPGSFERVGSYTPEAGNMVVGLPDQARIGRVEMGAAEGPNQDHNIVYAIIQDAVRLNDGLPYIDAPPLADGLDTVNQAILAASSEAAGVGVAPLSITTAFNSIYMSPDFGDTWILMASTSEIADNPSTGSSLSIVPRALIGFQPGVQAWYNMWIHPDPTRADPLGFPTRLVFGLEEVYQNRLTQVPLNGVLQQGPNDFNVIGTYFAGQTCHFLSAPYGLCPTSTPVEVGTTTHPDQQGGIWIPQADGGVCLIVGNDGGAYRQCVGPDGELDNAGWGIGNNNGFNTLLPYNLAVSKNGTVWMGLQDNGTAVIKPDQQQFMAHGGDGFYTAVHPTISNFAYGETTYADMIVTVDGGTSWADMNPPVKGSANGSSFSNMFMMDPTDPNHLITGGFKIVETRAGPNTRAPDWVEVHELGTAASGIRFKMTAVEIHGAAAYAGGCGKCSVFNPDAPFQNVLATNVGGDAEPAKASSAGWHTATAAGLPNRYITGMEIDPENAATVYVALGGYSNAQWVPPGSYLDENPNIGVGHIYKSIDAGENFTDISGNLPNVRVSVIRQYGQQLIVGTDIGAFISSDLEGSLWSPLGNGLPNVTVNGIEFRPGTPDQMFISTFGRGIWTYDFATAGLPATRGQIDNSLPDPALALPQRGGSLSWLILILSLLAGCLSFRRQTRRGMPR